LLLIFILLIIIFFGFFNGKISNKILQEEEVSLSPNLKSEGEKNEFDGYIVQLQDEPVATKVPELQRNINSYRTSLIVKQDNVASQIKNIIPQSEIKSKYQNVFNGFEVQGISEKQAMQIESLPEVKKVYPNLMVQGSLMDSVPLINADDVWLLDENGNDCSETRNPCLTGEGIIIAMIDTGVDYTHPDLGGCFGIGCKVIDGWDFVNDDTDPMDDNGHGTHTAATAAGDGVLRGVAPNAKIYAYKVLNEFGGGYFSDVISSIERSVDPNQDGDFSDHVDVISMSLGANCKQYYGRYIEECGPNDPTSQAVDNAVDVGSTVVIAAGNNGVLGEGSVGSPGTAKKAITIGASYKKDYFGEYWEDVDPIVDQIVSFSSRGPVVLENIKLIKPETVAPGAIICAARYDNIFPPGEHPYYYPCLDENHVQLAGTSMATPHVAGAVALIKQKNPSLTPEEIKSKVITNSIDVGGDIYAQGTGRIDVLKSVSNDIITNPSKIDIGIIEFSSPLYTTSLNVRNDDQLQRGIRIIKNTFKEHDSGTEHDILSISENQFCLNPGEEKTIILDLDASTLEAGDYNSIINVESYNDCNFITIRNQQRIPIGFIKAYKLVIDIDTRVRFSSDEDRQIIVMVNNNEGLMFAYEQRYFSVAEVPSELIYYLDSNLIDVSVEISTFLNGLPAFTADITDPAWFYTHKITGIDLRNQERVYVEDIYDANFITNIEEILINKSIWPYLIEIEQGFGKGNLSYHKGLIFVNEANQIEGLPDVNNIFNVYLDIDETYYDDQSYLGFKVISKDKFSTGADSETIGSIAFKFDSPFTNIGNPVNVNISQPEIIETDLIYHNPFESSFPLHKKKVNYRILFENGGGMGLYRLEEMNTNLDFTKRFIYNKGFNHALDFGIEQSLSPYNYLMEYLVIGKNIPEDPLVITHLQQPLELRLSKECFLGPENYNCPPDYPEKGKLFGIVVSQNGELRYGLLNGNIRLTLPDLTVINYVDTQFSIVCGECQIGTYHLDWIIDDSLEGQTLELNKNFYYDGVDFVFPEDCEIYGDEDSDGLVDCGDTADCSEGIYCDVGHFKRCYSNRCQYIWNADMTIWDETDSGMPYGNKTKYMGDDVVFFANYTKPSSGLLISGATCNINFNPQNFGSLIDNTNNLVGRMKLNNGTKLYEYSRKFLSSGIFSYTVTCTAMGYETLTLGDDVVIREGIGPSD